MAQRLQVEIWARYVPREMPSWRCSVPREVHRVLHRRLCWRSFWSVDWILRIEGRPENRLSASHLIFSKMCALLTARVRLSNIASNDPKEIWFLRSTSIMSSSIRNFKNSLRWVSQHLVWPYRTVRVDPSKDPLIVHQFDLTATKNWLGLCIQCDPRRPTAFNECQILSNTNRIVWSWTTDLECFSKLIPKTMVPVHCGYSWECVKSHKS